MGVSYITFFGPDVTAAFSERDYPNKRHKSFLKEIDVSSKKFIEARQVHGDEVCIVGKGTKSGVKADALLSNVSGVALGIKTADCIPLFLFDPENKSIGLIHAGWRGLAAKIIPKTIKKMADQYGADPSQIKVAIGPLIRECCYEVKSDLLKKLDKKFSKKRGKSFFYNLIYLAGDQLLKSGIDLQNIQDLGVCTSCDNDRVFSYRKEQTDDRILSVIQLL